jgi:hypothetical protein
VARKRIRRKPGNKVVLALKRRASGSAKSLAVPSCANEPTTTMTTNLSDEVSSSTPHVSPEKGSTANNNGCVLIQDKDSAKVEILPRSPKNEDKATSLNKDKQHTRESIESKRERKAAKTLAIITGNKTIPFMIATINPTIIAIHSFVRLFVRSFTHSLINSFIHLFIQFHLIKLISLYRSVCNLLVTILRGSTCTSTL